MNENIKLKKQIKETFGYDCSTDCKFVYGVSPKELGEKIRDIIKSASKIKVYEFTTEGPYRIGGDVSSVSATLRNLGYKIEKLKIGYMEVIKTDNSDNNVESFAFGILDYTKECIKSICKPGEIKKIELSTYSNFASLQDAVVNIIGKRQKCNWHYMILRETENFFGRIEGTGQKRIESENKFFSDFEKCSNSLLAIEFRELSKEETDKKAQELKHYVLFMV